MIYKTILVFFGTLCLASAFMSCQQAGQPPVGDLSSSSTPLASEIRGITVTADATIRSLFTNNRSNVQVLASGVISRLLDDDVEGDRHQRFIVRLATGQTLLVAHNIDLAPRVPDVQLNEQIYVYGEYEWNAEGGVIHWTHADPDGRHVGGWIQYRGVFYP